MKRGISITIRWTAGHIEEFKERLKSQNAPYSRKTLRKIILGETLGARDFCNVLNVYVDQVEFDRQYKTNTVKGE